MPACAIVGGRDVTDAIRRADELIAFAETGARCVAGIIDGDGVSALLANDGEARHVGGAVADVNHVLEGHGAKVGGHVIVHVLRVIEQAFVDAEKELRLLRVADDAARKGDASFAVLGKFTTKHRAHVGRESRAINERLQSAADDVVLDLDAECFVLRAEKTRFEFLKHLRQAGEKIQPCTEFAQAFVGGAIEFEVVEQRFQVGEFAVVLIITHE